MGSLIHIAEIAGLLCVAYVVGWAVGYVGRRLSASARIPVVKDTAAGLVAPAAAVAPRPPAAEPAAPAAADAPSPTAAAQVDSPGSPVVAAAVVPVATVPVSGLDSLRSLASSMPLMPDPAKEAAGQPVAEDPGVSQTDALIADEPANVQAAGAKTPANPEIEERRPSTAETAAAPASKTPSTAIRADNAGDADQTPAGMFEAGPANSPGLAWAGQIRGQFAPRFEHRASAETPVSVPPERAELAAAPTVASENEPDLFGADGATAPGEDDAAKDRLEPAGLDVTLLSSIAEQLLPTGSAASLNAAGPLDQSLLGESGKIGEGAASAATVAPDAMPADIEVVADMDATPSLDAIVSSRNEIDEDAAMRAIEGNWSRRDVPAPTDVPELPDVTAAVSAAQVAVEQVLARNGVEIASDSRAQAAFGKPRGLPAARGGQRDDLKLIEGLGPLDESTLNNLGIFHFDQVAGWSEREVLWLENHAFARGRIGREQWQAQARLLAGGSDASPRARR